MKRSLIPGAILVSPMLLSLACAYIVLPEGLETSSSASSKGWLALPTSVTTTADGALRVDLTLRNETGDWSAMKAGEDKPAVLHAGGADHECTTVFVGTGGHRVAPGFQLRGYTAGTAAKPEVQPVYVECPGVALQPGATLSIDYSYVTGPYNYYEQEKGRVDSTLEIGLDEVAQNLAYPVGESIEGLVQKPSKAMEAINKINLELTGVRRTVDGLEFSWKATNPGEYPSYVHIGNPPVIGADGILYGFYETPDIISAPITPAKGTAEWTTEVAVPADVGGLYILLSVETGKARLFANYAIDITDR
ncbi:MAG TPA: hypothetical protein VK449_10350 [Anaerolineales bacterium]|nr:hypothetical protein [Anaerolineales bacterium]